jgi:DNA-binding protein HU-beta
MNDLHKRDLIRILAKRTRLTQATVETVLDAFGDELAFQLKQECSVVWTGIGTFEMRERSGRSGINPQTGERVPIPATRVPGFTCAAPFKSRVTGSPLKWIRKRDAIAAD